MAQHKLARGCGAGQGAAGRHEQQGDTRPDGPCGWRLLPPARSPPLAGSPTKENQRTDDPARKSKEVGAGKRKERSKRRERRTDGRRQTLSRVKLAARPVNLPRIISYTSLLAQSASCSLVVFMAAREGRARALASMCLSSFLAPAGRPAVAAAITVLISSLLAYTCQRPAQGWGAGCQVPISNVCACVFAAARRRKARAACA